jgi:hypothetical protein
MVNVASDRRYRGIRCCFTLTLVAAGLLSSAGTAQATLVYNANFSWGTPGAGTISSWDTSNPGANATTILSGIDGARGVATDSLGNIYVSSTLDGGSIRKYTQGGTFLTSLNGLGTIFALAFDSSDNLYYNVSYANETRKTTTSLTSSSVFATGSVPMGMSIDASGNVTVSYQNNGSDSYVRTYDSGGNLLVSLNNVSPNNPMDVAIGVARDGKGYYYVSNFNNGLDGNFYISRWDADGTLMDGAYITTSGYDPYGLLYDSGTLFVAGHGSGRIFYYELGSTANFLGEIQVGTGPAYMNFATIAPVPEPGTWALLAGGVAFMGWRKRGKVS